jgi:protoheme IX farnesyltransferase
MKTVQPAVNVLAFINLARLRIVGMVLVTCALGYVLSYRGDFDWLVFNCALLGTALLSAGSCSLNCYIERDKDALMPRTSNRPIPAGVIKPPVACAYGALLIVSGFAVLLTSVNVLAAILGLSAAIIYLALYTPLKQITWLNTSIGAIPGAIPPLIGWAAARGQLDFGGWILFAMLFIWQHTHFFPIAWMYRKDYKEAGFRMLPALEAEGTNTFRLTVLTAIILLPVSFLLYADGFAGPTYCIAALLSGTLLLTEGVRLALKPSYAAAQRVLRVSLIYLPVILAAVMIDRYCAQVSSHLQAWLGTVWRWS